MTILYNLQGVPVEVPEQAVENALKKGYTLSKSPLTVSIKNFNPDIAVTDIPVEITESFKQIEILLKNQSANSIQVKYGNLGSETSLPVISAGSSLRLVIFTGTNQITSLPSVQLVSNDPDNFIQTDFLVTFTANQIVAGTIDKVGFYANDKLLLEKTTTPYTLSYKFLATGQYKIYARVHSGNEYTTSNILNIVVVPNKRINYGQSTPSITLTTPTTGVVNQAITLLAEVSDNDGFVKKVEFFVDNVKHSELLSPPFSINFTPTQNKTYLFKAIATDDTDLVAESSTNSFIATNPINPLPVVAITSPTNLSIVEANLQNFIISATATDTDGINKVEFYNGLTKLGESNLANAGVYSMLSAITANATLTAKAFDTLGASADSSAVTVNATTTATLISTSLLAEYQFNEGSGAVLGDSSGNNQNLAIGDAPNSIAAPTWDSEGLVWTGTGIRGCTGNFTVPANSTAFTVHILCRPTVNGATLQPLVGGVSVLEFSLMLAWTEALTFMSIENSFNAKATPIINDSRWHVLSFVFSRSGGTVFYCDGVEYYSLPTVNTRNFIATKLNLGFYPSVASFVGKIGYLSVYNAAQTAAQVNQSVRYIANLVAARGITLAKAATNYVFDGNSLVQGFLLSDMRQSFPAQTMGTLVNANTGYYNVGIGGQRTSEMITRAIRPQSFYNPVALAKNILVVWEGTNDLYFGATATAAYNNIVAYCNARRAEGWKVAILTILPRTDGGVPASFETSRATVNSQILANWATFADAVVDVGAIAQLQDTTNTTYYQTDRVHLKNAACTLVANLVRPVVSAL